MLNRTLGPAVPLHKLAEVCKSALNAEVADLNTLGKLIEPCPHSYVEVVWLKLLLKWSNRCCYIFLFSAVCH